MCTNKSIESLEIGPRETNHKRLPYRYGGRDMRLTDVYGELITPILA
jgi:hypothetical protein